MPTKPDFQLVPVPQLPDYLTQEVVRQVRLHSISMVAAREDERDGAPCAGVFATVAGRPGIITARHVSEAVRRALVLVLMIGPHQVYRIRPDVLEAYAPIATDAPPPFSCKIPDIAFIPLSAHDKGEIEARGKAFYSVDRRHDDPAFALHADDGFWLAIGNPGALMRRNDRTVTSMTYITNVDRRIIEGSWDYLFVNLNLEANPTMPTDLGGMSGGGIWRARFMVDGAGPSAAYRIENPTRDIVLTGITFLQTALAGRQLIAHGPRSIYEQLRSLVAGELEDGQQR